MDFSATVFGSLSCWQLIKAFEDGLEEGCGLSGMVFHPSVHFKNVVKEKIKGT